MLEDAVAKHLVPRESVFHRADGVSDAEVVCRRLAIEIVDVDLLDVCDVAIPLSFLFACGLGAGAFRVGLGVVVIL